MYRTLSVGLLVGAFAAFVVLRGLAADPKDPPKAGTLFDGKITKIDTKTRMLTLSDVKTGTDKEKGTTDKVAPADKDKVGDTTVGQYMFEISNDAKVTLDGKTAKIDDLQSGQFAHVWSLKGDKTDKEKPTAADKSTEKELHLKTDHVEAFTKNPSEKKEK